MKNKEKKLQAGPPVTAFELIRAAVLANRGGFEEATDGQIMSVWDSLDAETQKRYLKGYTDADSDQAG